MANRFDQLIESWTPRLHKAFLDAIYELRNRAQIDKIAERLEKGDVDGALRAVGIDPVAFRILDRTFEAAFEAGGVDTARLFPPLRDPQGFRVVVQFNIRNPAAEQWLRNYSSGLVREIVDDQRSMVRQYLTSVLARGDNPRTTALDLVGRVNKVTGRREGGMIGLTTSQEAWVRKYADELASDSPAQALTRTLRDRRFDAAVKNAARDGEAIPDGLQTKMVTAYRNRALRYRAETIARKETITALHQGQQEAVEQAVNSGAIASDVVTFVWRTARDNRVRDSHAAMNGQEQPMGQKFLTGSGALLEFPGDPFGPPEEVINCRCWREPKIDFLAGVR